MQVSDRPHDHERGKRLAPDQVRAIAESIAAGERHTHLAERFGVSVETVGAIKSGTRWAAEIDEDLRARMAAASAGSALDAASARQIMAALESGRSGRSIAEEFGVSESLISAIKRGRAWAALDPGLPDRIGGSPRRGKALSESQVAKIKQRLLAGQSSRKVAEEFGVSPSTVLAIARGKTWAEVAPRGAGTAREGPAAR
jgi:transposase